MLTVDEAELESLAGRVPFEKFSGAEILLTGATGMVTGYLTRALLQVSEILGQTPPSITALVRRRTSATEALSGRFGSLRFQVADLPTWHTSQAFDYLIHGASPASPTKYLSKTEILDVNAGFLRSISRGQLPSRLMFISSGEVYASPQENGRLLESSNLKSADPRHLRSAYPEAKLAGEEIITRYHELGLSSTVSARLFHSFGPGVTRDDGRSFADFIWGAVDQKEVKLKSPGRDIRSFLYLEDACAGLLKLISSDMAGGAVNVGSDLPCSIGDLARKVAEEAGASLQIPEGKFESQDYVHSPNARIVPDVSTLKSLGWIQKYDLDETIAKTFRWAMESSINLHL